ncbi:hypothetical protein CFC21_080006 [Triticum aestivum]|uniref:Ubiquitin-like protease family profile domain-containing protein n=2 Tax=Triticum aestivum TaxID=4565 RepID=A0A9R1L2F1_WHEAT|nr:hypothetical protein CFC21_080006 [Triticum aestivum]
MQYIYWEKVEPIGLDTFDPLSREYPLMLNWPETEGKKRDDYDNMHGRVTGNIENCISEEYRRAKVAREGTVPEEEMKKPKRKGGGRSRKPSMSAVSSNTTYSMDRVMTYIKLLHKEVLNIPERCAQMVMERLNTEGVLYKPNKRDNNDEFDNVGEGVGMENGKYKSSKYWPDIESPTDVKIGTSFTGMNDTSVPVDDTGAPATTPGKGEATDPFIIDDNGNSPSSASTVRTKEFPSMSRTPQNADISGESMDALSPTKSEDTFESFPAESNIGNGEGNQENEDLFASSPHSILASSLNMTPDHIEADRVFVETLASSKKHAHRTVVDVPPPDGDICTPAMLHDVLTFKWLNGAIINAYCKHLQHRDFSNRYISTTWFPKFMLNRARGKTKSVNDLDSENVTKKTKVLARVMDEYFRWDKAYFSMHVNDNHWITIVMHTVKEEFQVLDSNSKGAISQRIRDMIATLRAEISKDIMEANSTLEAKKFPDVSSWPINEYKMPRQKDGVSCGLFVMWCIKYWDGDR